MCRVASVSFVLITTYLENFIGPSIRQQIRVIPTNRPYFVRFVWD